MTYWMILSRLLIKSFTEEQRDRFEYYRRCSLSRPRVRKVSNSFPSNIPYHLTIQKLMESSLGTPVSEEMVIIMGGVTKLYLGEIVEVAKEIQQSWGDSGPLAPCHIREAYRRIRREDRGAGGKIALPD